MKIAGLVAMSHAPGWDMSFDHRGPGERYVAAVADARRRMADVAPDVFVVFGPDHFRNFFYDIMPAFCVGAEAVEAFGDYGSPKGPLPGAPDLGRFIVSEVMAAGFDPAVSLHMGVDHGISQPYGALASDSSARIVPIMINCSGATMPSLRRCHQLGQAVGRAIRAFPGEGRVVVVGSGGLSHSPPSGSPFNPKITPERRDYLINGRPHVDAHNATMETMAAQMMREGRTGPINEAWDAWFLTHLGAGDLEPVLKLTDAELEKDAGTAGHEVRTWLAALGAWDGPIETSVYEPVPTWITGMGCISAVA